MTTFEAGLAGYQQDSNDQFNWKYQKGAVGSINGSYFLDSKAKHFHQLEESLYIFRRRILHGSQGSVSTAIW